MSVAASRLTATLARPASGEVVPVVARPPRRLAVVPGTAILPDACLESSDDGYAGELAELVECLGGLARLEAEILSI